MRNLWSMLTILVFICHTGYSGDRSDLRFVSLTRFQIDSLLTKISGQNLTVTDRMRFYSDLFIDMPYNLLCAGDGAYALYEDYPLVNFSETNCMVFCEHVLALSISDSWDNFFNNLQQIRYQNGIIGMRTRNHYTMADWLPENGWLLQDVTRKVAGRSAREVTRTISHRKFFAGKGISDMRYVLPNRDVTISYIPKEDIPGIVGNLKNGDIGALIFANKEDIFSAHMFMFFFEDGEVITRESSNSKMTTFNTPFQQWAKKIQSSDRYIGISVMRVREEIDQPGKIILPWDIAALKTNKN